jgi:hypothetical protein
MVMHTGAGKLIGYLASHKEAAARWVTFYDNTAASGTVLHKVYMDPGEPVYIRFGAPPEKSEAIPFSIGLTVDPGDCDVLVWSLGFQG